MIDLSQCKYGDKLVCRNDKTVIYIGKHPEKEFHILYNETIDMDYWKSNGEYTNINNGYNIIALAPKKHKLVGFINVNRKGSKISMSICKTRQITDSIASKRRIACIDLSAYNIEYTVGEGL